MASFNTFKNSVTDTFLTKINNTAIGMSNGVASLDASRLVPLNQIPNIPSSKVPVAQAAGRFTTPVTITFQNDVLGDISLDGGTSSLKVNMSLKASGATAGTYGSGVTVPQINVTSTGTVSSVKDLPIPLGSTSVAGLVKLSDSLTSTNLTEAATSNSVKVVYDVASTALSSSLKVTQRGVANGVASLDASGRVPLAQLPETSNIVAERLSNLRNIKTTGDATWSVAFNGGGDVTAPLTLTTVLTNPGTYGSGTTTPTFKVDAKGRITTISSTKIAPLFTDVVSTPTTLSGYGITDAYTKAQADAADKQTITVAAPPGMIMYYAARNAPSGWLSCEGQSVSRVTYAALFQVIGTIYGSGDGSTTFKLPDLRGEFIRGWDNGRGIDSARSLGSAQTESFKAHTHLVKEGSKNPTNMNDASLEYLTSGDDFTRLTSYQSTTTSSGGSETRPRNIALLPCIKT